MNKSPVLEKLTQGQLIQMIHGYQDKVADLECVIEDKPGCWSTPEERGELLRRIAELNRKAEVRIKILETRIVELETTLQYERSFCRRIA